MRLPSIDGGALSCSFAALVLSAHSWQSFCEGELGEAPWDCETFSPVTPDAYTTEWLPLPSSVSSGNSLTYVQIAGLPAFDEVTGERTGNAAVFVLTDGNHQCMLAESRGEAALFDAPLKVRNLWISPKSVFSSLIPCSLFRTFFSWLLFVRFFLSGTVRSSKRYRFRVPPVFFLHKLAPIANRDGNETPLRLCGRRAPSVLG